jgi:hypothetical protein
MSATELANMIETRSMLAGLALTIGESASNNNIEVLELDRLEGLDDTGAACVLVEDRDVLWSLVVVVEVPVDVEIEVEVLVDGVEVDVIVVVLVELVIEVVLVEVVLVDGVDVVVIVIVLVVPLLEVVLVEVVLVEGLEVEIWVVVVSLVEDEVLESREELVKLLLDGFPPEEILMVVFLTVSIVVPLPEEYTEKVLPLWLGKGDWFPAANPRAKNTPAIATTTTKQTIITVIMISTLFSQSLFLLWGREVTLYPKAIKFFSFNRHGAILP